MIAKMKHIDFLVDHCFHALWGVVAAGFAAVAIVVALFQRVLARNSNPLSMG